MSIYLVGGAIRDTILNNQINDFDFVVVGMQYEEMINYLEENNKKILHRNDKFFNVRVKDIKTGIVEDYSLCRKDNYTLDDKYCDITIGNLNSDLSRRDFTMNAIAYNINDKKYIDMFGGITHIKEKIIKCVGDPRLRFIEDPVRILRCIRFSIKYDFKIDKSIIFAIKQNKNGIIDAIDRTPTSRLANEFNKCLLLDNFKMFEVLFIFDRNVVMKLLNKIKLQCK